MVINKVVWTDELISTQRSSMRMGCSDQCLRNAGFKDIFKAVKDKENAQVSQVRCIYRKAKACMHL
jgi:hypothetical protein